VDGEGECLKIICVEDGTLGELLDVFLELTLRYLLLWLSGGIWVLVPTHHGWRDWQGSLILVDTAAIFIDKMPTTSAWFSGFPSHLDRIRFGTGFKSFVDMEFGSEYITSDP
jgi:hypothetical protein